MLLTPTIIRDHDHPELIAQWLERARRELPDVHENRRKQWASGRVALTLAFQAQGIALPLDCHFDGHQQVRELPEWRFSLSNTTGFGAAILVRAGAVGLDIERIDRAVAPGIIQRMHNAEDSKEISALELWCIKEAAYKTLSSEIQSKIWLNSIAVSNAEFRVFDVKGKWQHMPHSELIVITATGG